MTKLLRPLASLALITLLGILVAPRFVTADERSHIRITGRVVDRRGVPLRNTWVVTQGSRRTGSLTGAGGRYTLDVLGATSSDLAREPLLLRIQAQRKGWTMKVPGGAPELAVEMQIVNDSLGGSRFLVRSNDARVAAMLADRALLQKGTRVALQLDFVGVRGAVIENDVVDLTAVREVVLSAPRPAPVSETLAGATPLARDGENTSTPQPQPPAAVAREAERSASDALEQPRGARRRSSDPVSELLAQARIEREAAAASSPVPEKPIADHERESQASTPVTPETGGGAALASSSREAARVEGPAVAELSLGERKRGVKNPSVTSNERMKVESTSAPASIAAAGEVMASPPSTTESRSSAAWPPYFESEPPARRVADSRPATKHETASVAKIEVARPVPEIEETRPAKIEDAKPAPVTDPIVQNASEGSGSVPVAQVAASVPSESTEAPPVVEAKRPEKKAKKKNDKRARTSKPAESQEGEAPSGGPETQIAQAEKNVKRSPRARAATSDEIRRALEVLGESVPRALAYPSAPSAATRANPAAASDARPQPPSPEPPPASTAAASAPQPPSPTSAPTPSSERSVVAPTPSSDAPRETARPDSCRCRVEGTVEVVSDQPLPERVQVDVSIADQPRATSTVELFMGSPRRFELVSIPCTSHTLRVIVRSKLKLALVAPIPTIDCAGGGYRQARIVLEPTQKGRVGN